MRSISSYFNWSAIEHKDEHKEMRLKSGKFPFIFLLFFCQKVIKVEHKRFRGIICKHKAKRDEK